MARSEIGQYCYENSFALGPNSKAAAEGSSRQAHKRRRLDDEDIAEFAAIDGDEIIAGLGRA